MCWECRECFPHHRLQRKPPVSDPGMHHGTCVTHMPWCMPGSLTHSVGKTFPAFPAHAQPAILRIWQEAHWLHLHMMWYQWSQNSSSMVFKRISVDLYLMKKNNVYVVCVLIYIFFYSTRIFNFLLLVYDMDKYFITHSKGNAITYSC